MLLSELDKKFTEYYSKEFKTDESDSQANLKLRTDALNIFAVAVESGDSELAENIIELIAKNTGCEEDIKLFIKLSEPLKIKGILSESQINKVINQGSTRWV